MKAPAILLIVLSCAGVLRAQESPVTWPDRKIQDIAGEMVAREFWIGGVIAAREGSRVTVTPFGRKAWGNPDAIEQDTVFEIGSISKIFTTTILAMAIREGKVSLKDTVASIIGTEYQVSESAGRITLEELATHTSGLPRMPDNFRPTDNNNPYADYGRRELFAYLKTCEIKDSSRDKSAYSNLGMGLLGTLLEIRLRKTWKALVHDLITAPLGMKSTGPGQPGQDMAQGHSGVLAVHPWDFQALAAAGDLVSNAPDMMRLATAALQLEESPVSAAIQVAREPRADMGKRMKIGLGWHIFQKNGRTVIWHNGRTGGFSSFFGFEPAAKRALFIAINGNGPELDQLALKAFFPETPCRLEALPKPITVEEDKLKPCVGRYTMDGGLILDIRKKGHLLTVTVPGQSTFTLYPSAPNEFFLVVVPARCHFLPAKDGSIPALMWSQGGVDQKAKRLAPEDEKKEVMLSEEELKKYIGRYELLKGVIFTIRAAGGRLEAQLTGQPALPLYAESRVKFNYRVINASIVFELDEKGIPQALVLHQFGRDRRAPRVK